SPTGLEPSVEPKEPSRDAFATTDDREGEPFGGTRSTIPAQRCGCQLPGHAFVDRVADDPVREHVLDGGAVEAGLAWGTARPEDEADAVPLLRLGHGSACTFI